jgi:hypothetical protein
MDGKILTKPRDNRDSLYTDIKLNDTLCERYQKSMGLYDRTITKKLDQVMTASSDIGSLHPTLL